MLTKGETRIVLIAQRVVQVLNDSVLMFDRAQKDRVPFSDVEGTGGSVFVD